MTLARIILGLLAIAPLSGYDVKRHFDTTINHFWSADKAQIYRALQSLVDEGFATVRTVAGVTAPDKREHHITDAGRAALDDWLATKSTPQPERDPFLARLFFADRLSHEHLHSLLAERRAHTEALLKTLTAIRTTQPAPLVESDRMRWATLDNGIAHARAELAWLEQVQP